MSSESVDMSSENDFRHLRFSDARDKLDGFRLFNIESPQDMKNTVSSDGAKYNVRESLAWDSAFLTSPGVLELDELFGTVNSWFMDKSIDVFGHEEEILLRSGTLEPNVKNRVDKCDLRKSLAWDDAFFTNAGVLDPEELSIINRGFKSSGTPLPGVQEDVSRSNESNISVDSGSSSLKSIEIDLFEDISKLSHKSANKLSLSAPILKFQSVKEPSPSDKQDTSSRTSLKGKLTSRRQNVNVHGSERRTKNATLSAPVRKQLSAGSGELNSTSSRKPPKSSNPIKNTTVLPKRSASSASLLKVGTAKSASGPCLTIPKKPSIGNLDSVSYSSTPSPKSSALCFATAVHESVSSSLSSKSGSSFKTPLRRYTIRKRAELGSSGPSCDVFMPKSFSCISPDSSHDGWSSESSSTSTVKKSSNSKAYVNSSSRQVSLESIATRESALHQSCPGIGGQGRRVLNHHNTKLPLRTGFPSSISKNTKPSDLQMPSTKISYFDKENFSIATTDAGTRFYSGRQIATSKLGSGINNLNGPVNRAKNGKPRTISGNPKQNGHESLSRITSKKPTDVDEVQNASLNEPASSATIKLRFPMVFEVEKDSPQETTYKNCLGTEIAHGKGQDTAVEGIRSTPKAESKYDEGSIEGKFGIKHMEIIIHKASKKTLDGYEEHMNRPGKDLSILDDTDKENMYSLEEQVVDGLSKYVGMIDLGGDMMMELKVNKTPDAQSAILTLKL